MQLCSLFHELLTTSITIPDKHITWLTKALYSPSFCFRDSGYLEVSLTLLHTILSKSPLHFKRQFVRECNEFMDDLFALCTALLHLWIHHPGFPIPSITIQRLFSVEVSDPENTSSFHLLHLCLKTLHLLIEFHTCEMRVLEEWSELLFTSRMSRVEPVIELMRMVWERSFESICE